MSLDTISWILTVWAIIGAILNARGSIKGFYIWIVGNIGWVAYNLYIEEWALAALFVVYTLISTYGIYQWRKKKSK